MFYTLSLRVTCPTKKYLAYQIRGCRQPFLFMKAIISFLKVNGLDLRTLGLEDVGAVFAAKVA